MSHFYQGGGNRGGGRGGGRFNRNAGRNPGGYHGRGSHQQNPQHTPTDPSQKPVFELCKFYTRGSQCNNGDNCRQDITYLRHGC
jgi:hypothetical protein